MQGCNTDIVKEVYMKRVSLLHVMVLALALILSGCQGDVGPAGSPGANGADGANGSAGPQGPTGQSGTTGALISDPFKVTQFHGRANATEATRGPNNSANLCTAITAASVDTTTGKLVVDFTVKSSGADKVPCTADDVAYTGLPASIMTFRFAQLRPGDSTGDSTYWVNYVNVSKTATTGPGFATVPVTRMNQGSGETGSTTGGTWTDNGDGTYRYVTNAKLTDGITIADPPKAGTYPYDANLPHRVAIQMGDPDGTGPATMGANNAIYDFVPATGAPLADPREIVVVANCNECHGTLGLHGGGRLDTKMCVICHNPTQGEPNSMNIIDFKVMIHKIHMGKHLPSVEGGTPYVIYGFGTPPSTHDFSYVTFPAYPANCTKCHKNATKADNYKNNPNKEACGACHDGIDFSTGSGTRVSGVSQQANSFFASSNLSQSGHVGGAKTNADCTGCHQSSGVQGAIDTDPAPIPDTHDFMKKIKSEYTVDMTMSAPANGTHYVAGEAPVVTLILKDAAGTVIDPTTITDVTYPTVPRGTNGGGAWNLYVSGPRSLRKPVLTTAAAWPSGMTTSLMTAGNDLRIRTGANAALEDDYQMIGGVAAPTKLTGVISRTDTAKIQYQLADVTGLAPGTYVAFTYGYKPYSTGIVFSSLMTFQVGTATVEKKIATNCLDCHSSDTEATKTASTVNNVWHITSNYEHAAQFDPDYCGNCHDYQASQIEKAWGPNSWSTNATRGTTGTVSNKYGFGAMPVSKRVHGIHIGARLNNPLDNPGVDYSNSVFPQDIRNCEKCHPKGTSTGTWQLTSTDQKDSTGLFLSARTQLRLACGGCHDSDNTWAHMITMTIDPTPAVYLPSATFIAGPRYPDGGAPAANQVYSGGPFSGDEQESCKACHAPLGLGAAGTATGTLGALQTPRLTN